MTDGAGSAIAGGAGDYAPYGVPLSTGGPGSLTPYAFTGQWLDADTGLQYHRARWLKTNTANWLSVDPVFDFPGNFGSRYGYPGASPLDGSDPSGTLFTFSDLSLTTKLSLLLAGLIPIGIGVHLWQRYRPPLGYSRSDRVKRPGEGKRLLVDLVGQTAGPDENTAPSESIWGQDRKVVATTLTDLVNVLRVNAGWLTSGDSIEIFGHGGTGSAWFGGRNAERERRLHYLQLDYMHRKWGKEAFALWLRPYEKDMEPLKPIPIPHGVHIYFYTCGFAANPEISGKDPESGIRTPFTWEDDVGPAYSEWLNGNAVTGYTENMVYDSHPFFGFKMWNKGEERTYPPQE